MAENESCAGCGQRLPDGEFHPYLYCALYREGWKHDECEELLRESGFVRAEPESLKEKKP